MFDIYGDIVIIPEYTYNLYTHEQKIKLLTKFILLGYKKFFTRGSYQNKGRTVKLNWISPYKKPTFATKFLIKEDKYYFYGDISEAFYNPRYHNQRKLIVENLKNHYSKDLLIIGSGISPYTVYLLDHFNIIEFQPNTKARRYGVINQLLNKKNICNWRPEYKNESASVIISMIPSIDKSFHLKYNFKDYCIFYVLLDIEEVEGYKNLIESYYNSIVKEKKVRAYSKTKEVYRFELYKR